QLRHERDRHTRQRRPPRNTPYGGNIVDWSPYGDVYRLSALVVYRSSDFCFYWSSTLCHTSILLFLTHGTPAKEVHNSQQDERTEQGDEERWQAQVVLVCGGQTQKRESVCTP